METVSKAIGLIAICLAGLVGLAVLRGFVLASLWGWFVVPLGVPALGIAQAIGISLIVSLFLAHLARDKSDDEGEGWKRLGLTMVRALSITLLSWGAGAIVHGFM